MTKPDGSGGNGSKRCPECGVERKAGLKYCDFCGRKVAEGIAAAPPAKGQTSGAEVGVLKGLAVICLLIGILVYVGNRLRGQEKADIAPPGAIDGKRQAAATCEAGIRGQVRSPFRVIAFRSTLVAEERGVFSVSGTVELQSFAGDLQRKRYYCRVHPDARAGMVLDEGTLN